MYIKFADDPVRKRVSSAFGNICDSDPKKNTLKLVDSCFSIFNKAQQVAAFCELSKLNYPVDGFSLIDATLCASDTYTVFDNNLDAIVPVDGQYPLNTSKTYARGLMLWVEYPKLASDGSEVMPADMSAVISIQDHLLNSPSGFYFHEFFSHFANPDATIAPHLLNKVFVSNISADFSIKLKGLIIYTKTDSDPNKQC